MTIWRLFVPKFVDIEPKFVELGLSGVRLLERSVYCWPTNEQTAMCQDG